MAIFNRTFFDLNNRRGYCVDGAAGLPSETISDLKLSVPNRTETIRLASLFLKGESVRIVFIAVYDATVKPVALFTSDERSMIRTGTPYPLTGITDRYGGLIVFGEGIRNDISLETPLTVSEECLTRYEPSAIPYASLTCDSVKLTGDVRLSSGDPDRLVSDGIDVPPELFDTTRALRLALLDSGTGGPENPMIALANGVNAYFAAEGRHGPIYKLFGAMPDQAGRITIRLDEHFRFIPIGEADLTPSMLAIGTDLTTDEVCGAVNDVEEENIEEPENLCPPSNIEFEVIEYE